MSIVMILLCAWFIMAQDATAKQNIMVMFFAGLVFQVILWIF